MAKHGNCAVRFAGRDARGGEVWEIVGQNSRTKRIVVTSPASVAVLDEIAATHADALKRLADE